MELVVSCSQDLKDDTYDEKWYINLETGMYFDVHSIWASAVLSCFGQAKPIKLFPTLIKMMAGLNKILN